MEDAATDALQTSKTLASETFVQGTREPGRMAVRALWSFRVVVGV